MRFFIKALRLAVPGVFLAVIFISSAVSSNADYIVTGDNHLLKIKEFNGIKIINSRDFIEIITHQT